MTPATSPSVFAASIMPAVEEHRAARQRERVDLLLVHHLERVAELGVPQLGRDRGHELLRRCRSTYRRRRVVQHRQFLLNLCRRLPSELHVVRRRYLFGGATIFGLSPGRARDGRRQEQPEKRAVSGRLECHGGGECKYATRSRAVPDAQ